MKPEVVARAERVLGGEAESWRRVESGGWARNEHWTLVLGDGSRAFAKSAWLEPSVTWMRQEREVYEHLSGPFMPEFLGWEDGERPLLVLEDLTEGSYFPPPWRPGDVDIVLETLAGLGATEADGLTPFPDSWPQWTAVADDPLPFLSLGIASAAWLDTALPQLLAAESEVTFSGTDVVHGDLRGDNLCIRSNGAVLFDWNNAVIGNSAFDVAAWLPSLTLEGGPPPDEVADDAAAGLAVVIAGFFAARAGLPPHEGGAARSRLPARAARGRAALGLSRARDRPAGPLESPTALSATYAQLTCLIRPCRSNSLEVVATCLALPARSSRPES